MRCYYTTYKGRKILIPGCWGTAIYGIKHCNCRSETKSNAQFEKEKYNEVVKELEKANKELRQEVFRLERIIRKLTKIK